MRMSTKLRLAAELWFRTDKVRLELVLNGTKIYSPVYPVEPTYQKDEPRFFILEKHGRVYLSAPGLYYASVMSGDRTFVNDQPPIAEYK